MSNAQVPRVQVNYGRQTEQVMLDYLRRSDRATINTFEVTDRTQFAREALSHPGTRIVASHRSSLQWEGSQDENAYVFDRYSRAVEASPSLGKYMHAKTATFYTGGRGTWLVGTANVTETGLAAPGTAERYRRDPGVGHRFISAPDATQYNAYIAGTDLNILRQIEAFQANVEAGRPPVSTENVIVSSPADRHAAQRIAALINNPRDRNPLYIASATLTNPVVLSAILGKARRGDQVFVGLGGVRQQDFDNQQRTMSLMGGLFSQHPELADRIHVHWASRPWHASLMTMGDLALVFSARFSNSALSGDFNGQISTEGGLIVRDAGVAARFRSDMIRDFHFSKPGTTIQMMWTSGFVDLAWGKHAQYARLTMPEYKQPRTPRDWVYLLSHGTVFDEGFQHQAMMFALQHKGAFRNPLTTLGRYYQYFYEEVYAASHKGQQPDPRRTPQEVKTADRRALMPTLNMVLAGRLANMATYLWGPEAGALLGQLAQPRGNRGPIGTLLINAAMRQDRAAMIERQLGAWNSPFYRPQDPREEGVWSEVARQTYDTFSNLGLNMIAFGAMHWTTEVWWRGISWAGDVGRTGHDWLSGRAAAGSTWASRFLPVSSLIGNMTNFGFNLHAEISRIGIELTSPIHHGILGSARANQMQRDLHILYNRNLLPGGERLTYFSQFREKTRITGRYLHTVPVLGWFLQSTQWEPEHGQSNRLFWRGVRETFRGQFQSARYNFGESWVEAQRARVFARMYAETGGGPSRAAGARTARGLAFVAAGDRLVGQLLHASRLTLEQQIDVENRTNRDTGYSVVYATPWEIIKPQSILEVVPNSLMGMTMGLSWLGEVAVGLLGETNSADRATYGWLGGALHRANKLNAVALDTGGNWAIRGHYKAGLRDIDPERDSLGAIRGVFSYWIDNLQALNRNWVTAQQAWRSGLTLKILSKPMATAVGITEMSKRIDEATDSYKVGTREWGEAKNTAAFFKDFASEYAGGKGKAEITVGHSLGIRVGALEAGGAWFGGVTVGAKTTFMMSLIGPMPLGISFGLKAPFAYNPMTGRDRFNKWFDPNPDMVGPSSYADSLVAAGIQATGGANSWFGRAVRFGLSFEYEPGTSIESAAQFGVATLLAGMNALGDAGPGVLGFGLVTSMVAADRVLQAQTAVMRGGSSLNALQRLGEYIRYGTPAWDVGQLTSTRIGVLPGPTLNPFRNVGVAITARAASRRAAGVISSAAGLMIRTPIEAVRLTMMLPVEWPAHLVNVTGRVAEAVSRAVYRTSGGRFGADFIYQTSHVAQAARAYRIGAGVAAASFFGYVAWSAWEARRRAYDLNEGGDPRYREVVHAHTRWLAENPLLTPAGVSGVAAAGLGLGVAGVAASAGARAPVAALAGAVAGAAVFGFGRESAPAIVASQWLTSYFTGLMGRLLNVREGTHRTKIDKFREISGPAEAFGEQMHPVTGKYQPGWQGAVQMWLDAGSHLLRSFKGDELIQTVEFSTGQGGWRVVEQTMGDEDVHLLNKPGARIPFGWFTATSAQFQRVVTHRANDEANLQLAISQYGSWTTIRDYRTGRNPRFMGKMFLQESAAYKLPPSLKIALSVRHSLTRSLLSSHTSEFNWFLGAYKGGKRVPAPTEEYTTYTATLTNQEGKVIRQLAAVGGLSEEKYTGGLYERFEDLAKTFQALWRPEELRLATPQGVDQSHFASFSRMYQRHAVNQAMGLDVPEIDDDMSAFTGPPQDVSTPMLRPPLNLRQSDEFMANWLNDVWSTRLMLTLGGGLMIGSWAMGLIGEGIIRGSRAAQGARNWQFAVQDRVRQHLPSRGAAVRGAALTPMTLPSGSPRLSSIPLGLYELDLPGPHGSIRVGDWEGRPFGHTYGSYVNPRTGRVTPDAIQRYGRVKAVSFGAVYDAVRQIYSLYGGADPAVMPLTRAGGIDYAQRLEHLMTNALDPSQGGTRTSGLPAGWQPNQAHSRVLADLRRVQAELQADGDLGRGWLRLERATREMLQRFPEVAHLRVSNWQMVESVLTQQSMLRRMGYHIASHGVREARSVVYPFMQRGFNASMSAPGWGDTFVDPLTGQRVVTVGDNARGLREAERMFGGIVRSGLAVQAGRAGRWTGGAFANVARGFGRGINNVGRAFVFTQLYHAAEGLAVAGSGNRYFTPEERRAVSEDSGMVALGLGIAGAAWGLGGLAAMIPVAGPALAAGINIVGLVAAIGLPMMVERRDVYERGSGLRNWLDRVRAGATGGYERAGEFVRNDLGQGDVAGEIANRMIALSFKASQSLKQMAIDTYKQARQNKTSWWAGGVEALGGALNFVSEIILGPARRLAEPSIPGSSFTLNSGLWRSKSPIFWAKDFNTFVYDAGSLEIARQIHLRDTADPIGASLYDMISHETLGIRFSSNDDPRNLTFEALYMARGAKAGGLGSAQAPRAFKYHPVKAVDRIIAEELHRRAVLYEVGILGGAMEVPGYKGGGFTGYSRLTKTGKDGRWSGPRTGTSADIVRAFTATLPGGGTPGNGAAPAGWTPYFKEAAAKYGVSETALRKLAWIETRGKYTLTARSHAGALGPMQIMPFNIRPGEDVTDPRTAIMVGARVYSEQRRALGRILGHEPTEVELAQAYNSGAGRIGKTAENREYAKLYQTRANSAVTPMDPATEREMRRFEKEISRLDSEFGGDLDRFMHGLGYDAQRTEQVRDWLKNSDIWLHRDNPTYWNMKFGSMVGMMPNAQKRAEQLIESTNLAPSATVAGREVVRGSERKTGAADASLLKHPGQGVRWAHPYNELRHKRGGGTRRHHGIDVVYTDASGRTSGVPIPARDAGVVVYVGPATGFGDNLVVVAIGDGYYELYGHGNKALVEIGARVQRGQNVILQGNQGKPGIRDHLHFEVRRHHWRNPAYQVDPSGVFSQRPLTTPSSREYDATMRRVQETWGPKYRGDTEALLKGEFGFSASEAKAGREMFERDLAAQGYSAYNPFDAQGRERTDIGQRRPDRLDLPDGRLSRTEETREDSIWTLLESAVPGIVAGIAFAAARSIWGHLRRPRTAQTAVAGSATGTAGFGVVVAAPVAAPRAGLTPTAHGGVWPLGAAQPTLGATPPTVVSNPAGPTGAVTQPATPPQQRVFNTQQEVLEFLRDIPEQAARRMGAARTDAVHGLVPVPDHIWNVMTEGLRSQGYEGLASFSGHHGAVFISESGIQPLVDFMLGRPTDLGRVADVVDTLAHESVHAATNRQTPQVGRQIPLSAADEVWGEAIAEHLTDTARRHLEKAFGLRRIDPRISRAKSPETRPYPIISRLGGTMGRMLNRIGGLGQNEPVPAYTQGRQYVGGPTSHQVGRGAGHGPVWALIQFHVNAPEQGLTTAFADAFMQPDIAAGRLPQDRVAGTRAEIVKILDRLQSNAAALDEAYHSDPRGTGTVAQSLFRQAENDIRTALRNGGAPPPPTVTPPPSPPTGPSGPGNPPPPPASPPRTAPPTPPTPPVPPTTTPPSGPTPPGGAPPATPPVPPTAPPTAPPTGPTPPTASPRSPLRGLVDHAVRVANQIRNRVDPNADIFERPAETPSKIETKYAGKTLYHGQTHAPEPIDQYQPRTVWKGQPGFGFFLTTGYKIAEVYAKGRTRGKHKAEGAFMRTVTLAPDTRLLDLAANSVLQNKTFWSAVRDELKQSGADKFMKAPKWHGSVADVRQSVVSAITRRLYETETGKSFSMADYKALGRDTRRDLKMKAEREFNRLLAEQGYHGVIGKSVSANRRLGHPHQIVLTDMSKAVSVQDETLTPTGERTSLISTLKGKVFSIAQRALLWRLSPEEKQRRSQIHTFSEREIGPTESRLAWVVDTVQKAQAAFGREVMAVGGAISDIQHGVPEAGIQDIDIIVKVSNEAESRKLVQDAVAKGYQLTTSFPDEIDKSTVRVLRAPDGALSTKKTEVVVKIFPKDTKDWRAKRLVNTDQTIKMVGVAIDKSGKAVLIESAAAEHARKTGVVEYTTERGKPNFQEFIRAMMTAEKYSDASGRDVEVGASYDIIRKDIQKALQKGNAKAELLKKATNKRTRDFVQKNFDKIKQEAYSVTKRSASVGAPTSQTPTLLGRHDKLKEMIPRLEDAASRTSGTDKLNVRGYLVENINGASGEYTGRGDIRLTPKTADHIEDALQTGKLTEQNARGLATLLHEQYHSISGGTGRSQYDSPGSKALEESLVEHLSNRDLERYAKIVGLQVEGDVSTAALEHTAYKPMVESFRQVLELAGGDETARQMLKEGLYHSERANIFGSSFAAVHDQPDQSDRAWERKADLASGEFYRYTKRMGRLFYSWPFKPVWLPDWWPQRWPWRWILPVRSAQTHAADLGHRLNTWYAVTRLGAVAKGKSRTAAVAKSAAKNIARGSVMASKKAASAAVNATRAAVRHTQDAVGKVAKAVPTFGQSVVKALGDIRTAGANAWTQIRSGVTGFFTSERMRHAGEVLSKKEHGNIVMGGWMVVSGAWHASHAKTPEERGQAGFELGFGAATVAAVTAHAAGRDGSRLSKFGAGAGKVMGVAGGALAYGTHGYQAVTSAVAGSKAKTQQEMNIAWKGWGHAAWMTGVTALGFAAATVTGGAAFVGSVATVVGAPAAPFVSAGVGVAAFTGIVAAGEAMWRGVAEGGIARNLQRRHTIEQNMNWGPATRLREAGERMKRHRQATGFDTVRRGQPTQTGFDTVRRGQPTKTGFDAVRGRGQTPVAKYSSADTILHPFGHEPALTAGAPGDTLTPAPTPTKKQPEPLPEIVQKAPQKKQVKRVVLGEPEHTGPRRGSIGVPPAKQQKPADKKVLVKDNKAHVVESARPRQGSTGVDMGRITGSHHGMI